MSNLKTYQELTPLMNLEMVRDHCRLFNKNFRFEVLHPIDVEIYNMLIVRMRKLILNESNN
jgi:hypothetical protein